MRLSVRGQITALIVAAAVIGASPGIEGRVAYGFSESKSLAVPAVKQVASKWCWAAATNSILRYQFQITYCQDTQAKDMFGANCVCGEATVPSSCNQPATLGMVANLIEAKKGVYTTLSGRDVTWAQFKSQLVAGHPLWIRYGWQPNPYTGLGHVVVARAYYWSDTLKQLGMMDPTDASGGDRWPWYNWSYFLNNSVFYWTNTLWNAYR